jgi:hypothetical protein
MAQTVAFYPAQASSMDVHRGDKLDHTQIVHAGIYWCQIDCRAISRGLCCVKTELSYWEYSVPRLFTNTCLTTLFRVKRQPSTIGTIARNEYGAPNNCLLIEGYFVALIRRAWGILPGRGSRRRSETPHAQTGVQNANGNSTVSPNASSDQKLQFSQRYVH